jgi:tRNA 2-thiouridine synthesizing protein C
MKTLAVINSSAPYGSSNYRESLDLLLANASYDRPVALFFFGDGLYQLLDNQAPEVISAKDTSKMFGLLDLYDIEQIYFCQQSLNERNINPDTLIVEGEILAPAKWFATLATFDQVVNF